MSRGRQNTDHVLNPILFADVMLYCDCLEEFDGYERLRYWEMVSACDVAFITATVDKRQAKAKLDATREKNKFRRKRL